jgi:tetratricopeptide (TPR) repeat protein
VTVYLTWSPWHFSGQNYGLALMFARRRGIVIEPVTKRFVYASFAFSFVLSILVLHSAASEVTVDSAYLTRESVFHFLSLGIPRAATRAAIWIASIGYFVSIAGAGLLLVRRARPLDLLPVASIALMQSLWFALPAALPAIAGMHLDGPAFAVAWVSAAHGAQYLWVTSFYASQQALAHGGSQQRDRELRGWWMSALLAGSAVTIFPAIVFAPALLGTLPWDNGLSMLLIAVVNLHHFVLDGAIWKLRDHRVARLLLREVHAGGDARAGEAERIRWGRPVVAALGTMCLGVALFDFWQRDMVINRAGQDVAAIARASGWLAWIGREPASAHAMIAARQTARGEFDEAIRAYRRSLAIYESADGWRGLGFAYASRGEWSEATDAYRAAVALSPDDATLEMELRRVAAVASGAP